ncbi:MULTISPECIES: alcohol dehydrogenase catalytic domain-containing protein [unclassified Thermoactinomyces]|jgi:threonine dehydrogenase-like Zn-dependent dehydrogenase|uniref:Alcohol dehydrogenase catalytic domain-containing protein n=1 Tax=Thermoactinomyces daqus TaxID=1329516 RepID=A0A7W2AGW0_9BACL|nr:alcohol dehydrogenase catalytic domain-containing protein [Thermoactinomyces daqus]MBH8597008.1 alcohol dehydrogenase catalytic domain-containing protein [Thermoactinomyces sp. CICC 10523]MBH8603784.1 alcohol dehydrogenase catalytic domain-containing protein [Thermoactinomyces sp. CICC 10522]MBH8608840.1 alcohol dehydrogenase catalytic domain-containing protein [Thermoactinomyces sp. CICC 10521]
MKNGMFFRGVWKNSEEVKCCVIGGSDVRCFMISGLQKYTLILGQEFCGPVIEIGGNAGCVQIGGSCGRAPLLPCGK